MGETCAVSRSACEVVCSASAARTALEFVYVLSLEFVYVLCVDLCGREKIDWLYVCMYMCVWVYIYTKSIGNVCMCSGCECMYVCCGCDRLSGWCKRAAC